MCEFCENIRTGTNFETLDLYIVYGNDRGNEKPEFYIEIPTDEGVYYGVDNIKFCPYCGRKLGEK